MFVCMFLYPRMMAWQAGALYILIGIENVQIEVGNAVGPAPAPGAGAGAGALAHLW